MHAILSHCCSFQIANEPEGTRAAPLGWSCVEQLRLVNNILRNNQCSYIPLNACTFLPSYCARYVVQISLRHLYDHLCLLICRPASHLTDLVSGLMFLLAPLHDGDLLAPRVCPNHGWAETTRPGIRSRSLIGATESLR